MLKNPKLTIFSDEVFNVIKMPQCEFNYSVSRKFKRKKINYFVSNNFLKDFEIFSENPQSHLQFLDDCLPYFQGSINPENELI
ncbi:MAG: hypothetical protein S4CHLAM7_07060 [Chlamydiae bacterium]|nr:hypothetical protein [Chlamydiota bacterium]